MSKHTPLKMSLSCKYLHSIHERTSLRLKAHNQSLQRTAAIAAHPIVRLASNRLRLTLRVLPESAVGEAECSAVR